jgi:hypothetical protein
MLQLLADIGSHQNPPNNLIRIQESIHGKTV